MKNYEITEEQIKELAKGNAKVKKWFPEVFESKLEIGKWKKTPENGLYCPKEKTEDGFLCYGFDVTGIWREINVPISITKDDVDATDSEVEEALTNEAKKKGLIDGVFYISPKREEKRVVEFPLELWRGNLCDKKGYFLMNKDGVWGTLIKTYTKEEAEKLLNGKIV